MVRGDEGRFRHPNPASPDIYRLDVMRLIWNCEALTHTRVMCNICVYAY